MECTSNQLVFNESKTQAWIVFTNSSESLPWSTKKEALFALEDCQKKNLITRDEYTAFIAAILESFLDDDAEEVAGAIEDMLVCIVGLAIIDSLEREQAQAPVEILSNPYFEMCDCHKIPQMHGYITNGAINVRQPVFYKTQGYLLIQTLLEKGTLQEEDTLNLRVQIEISPLPESPPDPRLN